MRRPPKRILFWRFVRAACFGVMATVVVQLALASFTVTNSLEGRHEIDIKPHRAPSYLGEYAPPVPFGKSIDTLRRWAHQKTQGPLAGIRRGQLGFLLLRRRTAHGRPVDPRVTRAPPAVHIDQAHAFRLALPVYLLRHHQHDQLERSPTAVGAFGDHRGTHRLAARGLGAGPLAQGLQRLSAPRHAPRPGLCGQHRDLRLRLHAAGAGRPARPAAPTPQTWALPDVLLRPYRCSVVPGVRAERVDLAASNVAPAVI